MIMKLVLVISQLPLKFQIFISGLLKMIIDRIFPTKPNIPTIGISTPRNTQVIGLPSLLVIFDTSLEPKNPHFLSHWSFTPSNSYTVGGIDAKVKKIQMKPSAWIRWNVEKSYQKCCFVHLRHFQIHLSYMLLQVLKKEKIAVSEMRHIMASFYIVKGSL